MQRVFYLFFEPGEITEIRALGLHGKNKAWEGSAYGAGAVSGYYDNPEAFGRDAAGLETAGARGIYYTINPINKALLARAANRLKANPKSTTQDVDVTAIRWLPIDLDCKRPADISATDEELAAAKETAAQVSQWLEKDLGFARAIRAMSGNGYHLYYRLPDLPNNEQTHELIVKAMAVIAARYGSGAVDVDLKVVNPARLMKIPGTTGRKGDHTAERPHRKSYLFEGQPEHLAFVPITDLENLQKLAAIADEQTPEQKPPPASEGAGTGIVPATAPSPSSKKGTPAEARPFKPGELGPLKVDEYLDDHGIPYTVKQKGARTLYCLEKCLFNPDHDKGQASIIASPSGPLVYQCFHNSCKDKTWKDARAAISGDKPIAQWCAGYDPDWKPPRSVGTGVMREIEAGTDLAVNSAAALDPPEEVDPLEFFEKRGKRPVFVPMYLARYLAAFLGPIVHTSGTYWRYDPESGIWKPFPETKMVQLIVAIMKDRSQKDMIGNTSAILAGLVNQEEDQWPNDQNLLCLKNGVLDLKSMAMLPHEPGYGFRIQLPVNYDEGNPAWSDRWWRFLQEIFPADESYAKRGLMQQYYGYCFLRDCRFQMALFLYGTGANGKSTALDCLQAMLGFENTSSIALHDIGKQFKGQFLYNKFLNIAGETNSRDPLDTDFLKKVISGDPVTCEEKYGKQFQFRPYAKIICAMNEPPTIPDKSYGFGRRFFVINFERRFTRKEISDRITELGGRSMSEYLIEEIDGIFSWALEGLRALLRNAGFRVSDEIQEDTEQLMEALNPLLIFINEMCELREGARVETTALWECYKHWCAAGKNRPLGRNKFLDQVRMTFPTVRHQYSIDEEGKKRRSVSFDGIALTRSAQDWLAEQKTRYRKRMEALELASELKGED